MKNLFALLSVLILLVTGLIFGSIEIFQGTGVSIVEGKLPPDNGSSEEITPVMQLTLQETAFSHLPSVRQQALKNLFDILDYPLEEGTGVPRIEVSSLPDAYTDIIDTKLRKSLFLRLLLPLVLLENEKLVGVRNRMNMLLERIDHGEEIGHEQLAELESLSYQYGIKGDPLTDPETREMLRKRVDIVPPSLALAQAANESGWGNSRFAREASNLFGIWTFNKKKGLVPEKRGLEEKHLVRKFDSLRDSVTAYMHTLNTHPAYTELRGIRYQLKESGVDPKGTAIAEGLRRYSILGEEYIRLIQEIITMNNLESLDSIRLQSV